MILIAHRGNIYGSVPEYENNPIYLQHAIQFGFDVEVDVREKDGTLYFGHDEPQYKVDLDWFEKFYKKLWLHCKDISVFQKFRELDPHGEYLNYFWHENDTLAVTSQGDIWAFPGKQPIKNSIAVMPELNNEDVVGCMGVCSDFIRKYKF